MTARRAPPFACLAATAATAALLTACSFAPRPPVDAAEVTRAERDLGVTIPNDFTVTAVRVGNKTDLLVDYLRIEPSDAARKFSIALHVEKRPVSQTQGERVLLHEGGCGRLERSYAAEYLGRAVTLDGETCSEPGGVGRTVISQTLPFHGGSLLVTADGVGDDFDNDAFRAIVASLH